MPHRPTHDAPRGRRRRPGARAAARALLLVAPLAPAGAQVTARWAAPEAPYADQTIEIRLELELDEAWSRESLVQQFARELGLPLQVDAFAGAPERVRWLDDGAAAGTTLVVDGDVVRALADVTVGDRRRVTVGRRARVTGTAPLVLPAPRVRYTAAASFREDLVQGRVPVDPEAGTWVGEPLELRPRRVPEDGRPLEFNGAVGTYELASSVQPRALAVGEDTVLTVLVRGDGPLPDDVAPRLAPSASFEERGLQRDAVDGATRFRFTLRALQPDATRAPDASLVTFEPASAAEPWRTVVAEGPAVAVRPASARGRAPQPPPQPQPPPAPGAAADVEPDLTFTYLTLGAVAVLAVVSALRRIRFRAAARAAAAGESTEGAGS